MRLQLSTIILAEAAIVLFFLLLGVALAGFRSEAFFSASMTLILLLMHIAVVPVVGKSFVIYDAAPDSAMKYYFFASIFAAAFGARYVRDAAVAYIG